MSSRSFGGEAQRATPGSTASGPAPAARGRWESSGTRAPSAAAAATGSAAGAAWGPRTGSARSVTPTGELTQRRLKYLSHGAQVRAGDDCRRVHLTRCWDDDTFSFSYFPSNFNLAAKINIFRMTVLNDEPFRE